MSRHSSLEQYIQARPEGPVRVINGKGFSLEVFRDLGACDSRNWGEMKRLRGATASDPDAAYICEWDGSAYTWQGFTPAFNDDRYVQIGTDPNADRIYFWDDSAGAPGFLAPDSSLSISGTTLSVVDNYVNITGDTMTGDLVGQNANLDVQRYVANQSTTAALTLSKSRNATPGSHTIVQADDLLATLLFRGSDGTAFRDAARIRVEVDGTPGASDMPGRIVFLVTPDGSATAVEVLRLAQDKLATFAGEARVTTAGTNAASVVTVGGTQTLTNKTLTTPVIASISNTGTITLPTVTGTAALTSVSSSVTLGTWYAENLVGTASDRAMALSFMPTTSTIGQSSTANGNAYKMPRAGRVVGMFLRSNEARTAGTATARISIAGTPQAFASGACVLNATDTATASAWDTTGVAFSSGDLVRPTVTTSSWTPTTADVSVDIVVRFDP